MSNFSDYLVPELLMPSMLTEHDTVYDYHLAEGDIRTGLMGMLMEGREREAISPGRYARIWIDTDDLPRPPRSADWLVIRNTTYDVESVTDTLFNWARLVIKQTGQSWQEE